MPKKNLQNERTSNSATLYMAMELSSSKWVLGFSDGSCRGIRRRTVPAGDLARLSEELPLARKRFGLSPDCPVVSCQEAGRDGFWIHRHLEAQGVQSLVVDSASIERSRHKRNPKTDRLDVNKLLYLLLRHHRGEPKVWRVVHVPDEAAEDQRHLHREIEELKGEATRLGNRIKGLLATKGVKLKLAGDFLKQLGKAKTPDGRPVGKQLVSRFRRQWSRLSMVRRQVAALEKQRSKRLRSEQSPAMDKVRTLSTLRGVGTNISWLLVFEFLGWRTFQNRKQVGSAAGLVGAPWNSGASERDQGISKAGNSRVRKMMVEAAWCWVRWQPDSKLTRWFNDKFGVGKRHRKVGIVALARQLLIALWRYAEFGVLPQGAQLKA